VRVVDPLTEFMVAVMVVVPALALEAVPLALIVATGGSEEFQVTEFVMSCVVPSLKVPVAAKPNDSPSVRLGVAGVTAMDTSEAFETDRVAEPIMGLSSAPMMVLPGATAVARPRLGEESLIVATGAFEEVQFTNPVKFRML
jgi:hypothetical protein